MSLDSETPDLSATPIGEAVVADAVGAHAAESSAHGSPVHTHCENCGTALSGPYCHRCGQHDIEFHRSFGHVFLDALENFFHFDAKLFRNVVTLLFRPGQLTAEFNAGKRASQMPPLRLYIFVSLIFFLLVFASEKFSGPLMVGDEPANLVAATVDGHPATTTEALLAASQNLAPESAGQNTLSAEKIRAAAARLKSAGEKAAAEPKAGAKASAASRPIKITGSEKSAFLRWIEEQGQRMVEPAHQKELIDTFFHSLPKMMLFCLPFFSLYTRVLFRKSGQVYLQHLVLALHFHTFVFLWIMFRDGWTFLAGLPSPGLARWIHGLCNLWLYLYPLLMLRRLFANSWKRTLLKSLALSATYGLTLGLGFVLTAFLVFLSV